MNVEQWGNGLCLLFRCRRPSHEVIDFVSGACSLHMAKKGFRGRHRIVLTKQSREKALY